MMVTYLNSNPGMERPLKYVKLQAQNALLTGAGVLRDSAGRILDESQTVGDLLLVTRVREGRIEGLGFRDGSRQYTAVAIFFPFPKV